MTLADIELNRRPNGRFGNAFHREPEDVVHAQRDQPGEYTTVSRHDWLHSTYDVEVNTATGLTDDEFSDLLDASLEAALWSTTDMDTGGFLDEDHTIHDFAPSAKERLAADTFTFVSENRSLVEQALKSPGYDGGDGSGPIGMLGHDLWLTRNGSGAGFWDREALSGDLGRSLTDAAHKLGELDIYVGDDGKVHA